MDGVDGVRVLLIRLLVCTAGIIPEGVGLDQGMRDKRSRLRW